MRGIEPAKKIVASCTQSKQLSGRYPQETVPAFNFVEHKKNSLILVQVFTEAKRSTELPAGQQKSQTILLRQVVTEGLECQGMAKGS